MNAPDPKIIDRIAKLMALSKDGGATEAEASLAATMAQRIMDEHNLSMATIEAAGGSTGEDGKREKSAMDSKAPYKWMRELMAEVAKLNFCHVTARWERRGSVYSSRTLTFTGYTLVGRAANVAATRVMFEYLVQSINRLALAEVNGDKSRMWSRFAASFREGCAHRLAERLQERREEQKREAERAKREAAARASHPGAAPGGLIVLSDVVQNEEDLNNDFRHGWEPGTTARLRAEREAKEREAEAERAVRKAEALAMGMTEDEAHYYSWGYSIERSKALALPEEEKPETDAQRRKRQQREDRQQERWREQARREQDRFWKNRDADGYFRGQARGDDVGLDQQLGGTNTGRLK